MCGYLLRQIGGRLRWAALGAGLIVTVLSVHAAQAGKHHYNYTYDDCAVQDSGFVVAHVVGEFTTDSKRKDVLTDWIDMPHPQAWSCTRYTSNPSKALEVQVKPHMPIVIQADYDFENDTYSIYKSSSHASELLGYIMRRRYHVKSDSGYEWTSVWRPVRHNNHNDIHQYDHYMALPDQDHYTVSIESQVRLLKWYENHDFPRTGKAVEFKAANWRYWVAQHGAPPAHLGLPPVQSYGSRPRRDSIVRVWFNREDKTCTTPEAEKTVYLPAVPKSSFTGVGSTAGHTGFNLELTNCSSKVKGIEYKLAPVRMHTPSHDPTVLETVAWKTAYPDGTLPLGSHSTAKGLSVQVLDGGGEPVVFDRKTRLVASSYSAGDPAATIPLQAQYIQTAPIVTAGTVYATMTVLYMYK